MKYSKRMEKLEPSDIRVVGKLVSDNPGTISFAGGIPDPDFFPKEEMQAIAKEILENRSDEALQYGPTRGRLPLRTKIAERMKLEGVDCTADEIIITTGSQQGITLGAMLCVNPGDVILTEKPSYLGALSAFAPHEIQYTGVGGDEDGMNMDELEAKLKSDSKIKMIYVIPNFQNPSGRTWSLERRKKLMELANKYDVAVLEDNAYGELIYEGERLPSLKSMDTEGRVIYLGSFSKILSPGLRVAWICATSEICAKLELIKYGLDLQSAEMAQMQTEMFIDKYGLDDQIAKIAKVYGERRDAMLEIIKNEFPAEAKYYYPRGGMFVWVELPAHINTRKLLEQAVKQKVAFVPGGSFYPDNDCESAMRLNFSMMPLDKIKEGTHILAELLKEAVK